MDSAKSTTKLKFLRDIENQMHEKWAKEKIFQVDAPNENRKCLDEKFMGTFPFPYVNGRMHVGHSFSLSKLEVNQILNININCFCFSLQ